MRAIVFIEEICDFRAILSTKIRFQNKEVNLPMKTRKRSMTTIACLSIIGAIASVATASTNSTSVKADDTEDYVYGGILEMNPMKLLGDEDHRRYVDSKNPKYNSITNIISYQDKKHMYWITCTGDVISKRLVLTSAHCLWDDFYNRPYNDYVAVPGRDGGNFARYHNYDAKVDEENVGAYPYGSHATTKAIIPDEYKNVTNKNRNEYDWALLVLNEDVSEDISPDTIEYMPNDQLFDNRFKEINVVGYGMDMKFDKITDDVIRTEDKNENDGLKDFPDWNRYIYEQSMDYGFQRQRGGDDTGEKPGRTFYSSDVQVSGGEEGAPMRTAEGIVGIFSKQMSFTAPLTGSVSYKNQFVRITPEVKNTDR